MATKFSDVLGITSEKLYAEGAFDAFVYIDSRLYVDPHLLRSVSCPELINTSSRYTKYFEDIIRILSQAKSHKDRMYRQAISLLTFPELPYVSLGYSKSGSSGSGIGLGLAKNITATAKEIIDAGINDPVIFEIIGLLEEGIGADRISDMTIRIILPDLLDFSQRVASNLGVTTQKYHYSDLSYDLPYNPELNKPLILIPHEILRDLPVALDWSDIDTVCSHNENLRRVINKTIGSTWKKVIRKISKSDLKEIVLQNPDLLKDLVKQYSNKESSAYDIDNDRLGLFSWDKYANEYSETYPLKLPSNDNLTLNNVIEIVRKICNQFKNLIENNGLNKVLYDDLRNLRHEKYTQLLFFAIAHSYCEDNNLDLTRESDAGRGPVDFKISRGSKAKVTVEIKYSTNPQLVHGYETQLPIYNLAEGSQHSIYLILQTSRIQRVIEELKDLNQKQIAAGASVPELIVIDGQLKASASKA